MTPGAIGSIVATLLALLLAGVLFYLMYQDNLRLRRKIDGLEDRLDTVLRELMQASNQTSYFTGVLTHGVEQAEINKKIEDIKRPPEPPKDDDKPTKRRGGNHVQG